MVQKYLKELKKEIKKVPLTFYVNEEKGTVVARPTSNGMNVISALDRCFGALGFEDGFPLFEVIEGFEKVRGIAKCAPEDTFDEKIGKIVAKKKFQDKCYRLVYNRFNAAARYMIKNIDNLSLCIAYIAAMGYENARDILKITGGDVEDFNNQVTALLNGKTDENEVKEATEQTPPLSN